MATDIVSLLTQDEIPIKLRCARCNKLAVSAFRLPCCDQSICESCHTTLPEECPVCAHSPLTPDDCKPNKALRLTVKAFLKNEEKKRERAAAAAAAAEAKIEEPVIAESVDVSHTDLPDATPTADPAGPGHNDDDAAQPSLDTDAAARQATHDTTENGNHEEDASTAQQDANPRPDRTSTIERDTPEVEIITGDEPRQSADATTGDVPSQPKPFDQQPAMGQYNYNAYPQNMGWNPAMMQQMMAMQNGLNAGNWGGFPMMGMNGMGMDSSMMNMMGGMNMGGNNWGWNQQQGMGSMGTEHMMNMSGNFNATGGYAKHMANMNSGAGYNVHLMSQQGTSQSHMNINHGRSMSKDVAGGGAGGSNALQGDTDAGVDSNDFLPGDAGDSRPNSSGGGPPRLGLSTGVSNDTSSIQNGESAFSPMTQANGSLSFDHTNTQQINAYTQEDAASALHSGAPGYYGNDMGYIARGGRGGFRGRVFGRGRGGRFNDFDSFAVGPGAGQGVEGAPTGPKAMREPQARLSGTSRGGRGGFAASRGAFVNGTPAAMTPTVDQSAKSYEQHTPQDDAPRASPRPGSRSRSRSVNMALGEDRPEASTTQRERAHRKSVEVDEDERSRRNGTSNRQHREHETISRHESRRQSPDVDAGSDREYQKSSHRSSRHQGESTRDRDKERRHRSSRHHDRESRSRSRDRDRERRRHRRRSRSPGGQEDDRHDEDDEHRSSRHHRRREDRHRDRESDRDRDRDRKRDTESSRKEPSSRRDREYDRDRDRQARDRDRDRDRHRSSRDNTDRPSTSNGQNHTSPTIPTGPRNDASVPTGPRGTGAIPTGPRGAQKELRIQGRSVRTEHMPLPSDAPHSSRRAASPHARAHEHQHHQDTESTRTAPPEKYIDAHALEREARNRERLLKEQQRRGGGSVSATTPAATGTASHAHPGSGRKRRASGGEGGEGMFRKKGRGGVKYEDEDGRHGHGHGRARRVEEEREAARWG